MGDRDHCPVCDSYTSDLYTAFIRGDNCPHCFTSYSTVSRLEEIARTKANLKKKGISDDLVKRNELLEKQNAYLLEKVKKIEDGIWGMVVKVQEFTPELEAYAESIRDVREKIGDDNEGKNNG